jgi:hypothetical protein
MIEKDDNLLPVTSMAQWDCKWRSIGRFDEILMRRGDAGTMFVVWSIRARRPPRKSKPSFWSTDLQPEFSKWWIEYQEFSDDISQPMGHYPWNGFGRLPEEGK